MKFFIEIKKCKMWFLFKKGNTGLVSENCLYIQTLISTFWQEFLKVNVWEEKVWRFNNHVVPNKSMYTGKKLPKT